MQIKF